MTEEESFRRFTGMRLSIINWHKRLKERGFFRYIGRNVLWIFFIYSFLILLLFLLGKYLIDFEALISGIIDKLPARLVYILFFVSESFTGMIPVDLFVIWTQKFKNPLPCLFLLGALSYAGSVISYGIGLWISRRPRVKAYTERKLRTYTGFARKWGGAFIVIAALFPFTPFSLVVISLSVLRYPFRLFLLYALFRLFRFAIQGLFFFDLLKVDTWII